MTKKIFVCVLPFMAVLIMAAMLLTGCAKKVKPVTEEPKQPTIELPQAPEPPPPDTTGQALRESQNQMEADLKLVQAIYFEYDKSELRRDAQDALNGNAKFFQKYPQWKISIEGHCDERGTNEYNLALGERRAMSAYKYLISLGTAEDRLSTVSYGEERAVDFGHNESSWSKNRRDEFKIKY